MKKDVQGIVLLLVGVMVLRLAVGDQFLFYVAEGMKPFLIASGVACWCSALTPCGIRGARARRRRTMQVHARHEADQAVGEVVAHESDGHDHSRGPRIAYLLLLPVLAVYVVSPSALGSYSAERQTTSSTAPAVDLDLPALPAGTVAELPLRDYVIRSVWDGGATLQDRDVTMTGFVTPDPAGGWWLIAHGDGLLRRRCPGIPDQGARRRGSACRHLGPGDRDLGRGWRPQRSAGDPVDRSHRT